MQTVEVLPNSTFTPEGGEVFYRTSWGKVKREKLLKVEETDLKLPYKFLNPIQTLFYKFYKGGNALVSAPTSAGKTVVAFTFFRNREGRLVYTAPTKSLVSEKAKELKAIYGSVDIRTGDVIEEFKPVRSKVVVSTYENLALALRNGAPWTQDLNAVVVDEIHAILGNRGQVVEEIITELLLKDVDILALSATIPGAQKLARWLRAKLFIKSQWRPVPLERELLSLKDFKEWIPPKELGEIKGDERFALKLLSALFELSRPDEKVLVFVPKKNIGWKMLEFANRERLEIANKTAPFEIEREGMEIAFHNADVPKEEREEIEKAFREGTLNKLIATQTLAYGVNLPADKVIIAVKGFYDRQSRSFKFFPDVLDILQEEGRAGRFGIRDKGYSYILVYGSNLTRLRKELETALEGEFKPFLSREISLSFHRLGEDAFAKLTLFLLVAFLYKGRDYKEFLKQTFSLRDLADHPAVKDAGNWLIENGYADELYRPTPKGLFCLKSGVPPLNFEEFLRRKELPIPLIAKLRPLIYTKRLDGIFPFIRERKRFEEDTDKVGEILIPCGESCFSDNTDQLLFFTLGYTFYYPNISNPPGDFSYLGSDSLHLLRTLLELRKIGEFTESNETLLKIAHCLKYGLTEEFSPLGGIKGIGHIRANLLKEFLKTEGINRLSFTQKVGDIFGEFSPKELKENLAYLLMELRNLDEKRALREANITLSLLKRNSNSLLVDEKILRTFGLFLFGRESLGWKREELLKRVLED
ncbi:MAG: DEAD/DEAH box helicase [Gammaproteobacteria bacterium]|nr:MAG: DEAD/DEAH box helicase [Gammaproteobacteria bacterium]